MREGRKGKERDGARRWIEEEGSFLEWGCEWIDENAERLMECGVCLDAN